jgi:hypothetical protein
MRTAHLSFRHFSRPSRAFFRPFLRRILSLLSVNFYVTFKPSFTTVFNKCILPIFFPVTFSPFSPLFRLFSVAFYSFSVNFTSLLCLVLHDSNKWILSFFPSLFSPSALFRPFSSYLNIASHAFNKCVLPIFLFAAFLAFPPLSM